MTFDLMYYPSVNKFKFFGTGVDGKTSYNASGIKLSKGEMAANGQYSTVNHSRPGFDSNRFLLYW